MMSNFASTINGVEIPKRTKIFSEALKKKMVNIPIIKIIIPPISCHLKAIKTAINKNIHGMVLGKLLIIPLTPPPKLSAPDNNEKINSRIERVNKRISENPHIFFAIFCIPSFSILLPYLIKICLYKEML